VTVTPAARRRGVGELERRHGACGLNAKLGPAASDVPDPLDDVGRAGVDRLGRAEPQRSVELRRREIDGDNLPRAGRHRAYDRRQADAAETDDRDRTADGDARRVDDRADASQHRTAEQRGVLERQRPVDLDAGFLRDDGEFGEGGDAEMVVDRFGDEAEPA